MQHLSQGPDRSQHLVGGGRKQEIGGREDRKLLLVQRTDWIFLSPYLLPLDHHEFETTELQEPSRLLFSIGSGSKT